MRSSWLLIILLVFFGSCNKPEERITTTTELVANDSINSFLEQWLSQYDLTASPDSTAPPDLTAPIITETPSSNEYFIRTRVIIETATVSIPVDETSNTEITFRGFSDGQIGSTFQLAEVLFADLGIKFSIEQYVFMDYQPDLSAYWIDAARYQTSLSIYFLLPRPRIPFRGFSSVPWEPLPWGILMFPKADQFTMPHEIGHYFGLLHPFRDPTDMVDDTPFQIVEDCIAEKGGTPNCCNLMSYCNHETFADPPFLTLGQKERIRSFLLTKRAFHIVKKPVRTPIKLEELLGGAVLSVTTVEQTDHSPTDQTEAP